MKIKKRFIALCASALFFNPFCAKNVQAKDHALTSVGLPFINLQSVCVDDSAVTRLLSQSSDTIKSIKCYFYENDSDQVVVTSPIEINKKHMVFVFKVYKDDCLQFLFDTIVIKNEDIPHLYSEKGRYNICCE